MLQIRANLVKKFCIPTNAAATARNFQSSLSLNKTRNLKIEAKARTPCAFSLFKLNKSKSLLANPNIYSTSFIQTQTRTFSSDTFDIQRVRNIGISAHIDSGKTTLTERILFYTGRIHAIHEVKGKDGVGATMDSMDLEREKGITIQSAATHCGWKDFMINIIDTPGHVDFTIEVERSLRVLDGAIMVLCGVAGVQSQSLTVDRQMKRYDVPRVCFINKLDRAGANPYKPLNDIRKILGLNASLMQVPIGAESEFRGVIDLVENKSYFFDGSNGETVRTEPVPEEFSGLVATYRSELIERLVEVDDELAEIFLADTEPTPQQLKAAIRRATVSLKFIPVFMGSAFKNKGVQPLLDGVLDYLPNPTQKRNFALDQTKNEEKVEIFNEPNRPFVGLAFKLEERPFGQLTYLRVYQGLLKKGEYIYDVLAGNKVKVQRVVKMHANSMEDVNLVNAGEIAALFGIDCPSGATFTGDGSRLTMTSMHIPEPVISLSVKPKNQLQSAAFSKALARFQKEDPTFRVHISDESEETIISGMGELHLEIYVERMKREYKVDCIVGQPKVNYRETPTKRAEFNYTHKKQSGGAGQFGRVVGFIEPLPEDSPVKFEFVNALVGNIIPPEFYTAIEKGFIEAVASGLAGYPVVGCRVTITDGAAHAVDSNEISFRLAAQGGFRQAFINSKPVILEPIMKVEIEVPSEFQGSVVAGVNRRKGMIENVETIGDSASRTVVKCDVPLCRMFGYSTDLRSSTEGKGEFAMEYKEHLPVTKEDQEKIMIEAEKLRIQKREERK